MNSLIGFGGSSEVFFTHRAKFYGRRKKGPVFETDWIVNFIEATSDAGHTVNTVCKVTKTLERMLGWFQKKEDYEVVLEYMHPSGKPGVAMAWACDEGPRLFALNGVNYQSSDVARVGLRFFGQEPSVTNVSGLVGITGVNLAST